MDIPDYDLTRLALKPGEVLVARFAGQLRPEERHEVKLMLEPFFPDHPVLVVGPDVTFEAIDPSQVPEGLDGN